MDRFPVVIPWLDHGIHKYDKKNTSIFNWTQQVQATG
ncbi:hypothetical protein MC3_04605 [Rickettsia slovaca str. D-CWPP]|uniref:Uncharacterized protein n=1 Tax=Rickettsia slovaca str. D-CWPP TaxID=1105109 RepID=H8LNP7_RICSL|nr:hypothetical protein MC3_04605 [Rickettsia slovaca str. D-CWPP]